MTRLDLSKRKFLVAFGFAAAVDIGAALFHVSLPYATWFNGEIEYAARSVNIVRFGADVVARTVDRHHYLVWSLRAPFNLTVVCREARGPEYGDRIASLCVTRGRPEAAPGLPPSVVAMLPIRALNTADEYAYPRRDWLEVPLGVPDGFIYATACAWKGVDACAGTPSARSTWLGRTMFAAIVLLAIVAARPTRTSGWSPPMFVATFVVGLILWGVLAFGVVLLFGFISWISQGVATVMKTVLAIWAFWPIVWAARAARELALDKVKNRIAGASG